MDRERAMGTPWILALTLVLGLGLALGLTTMVRARESAAPNAAEAASQMAGDVEGVRQPQDLVREGGPALEAVAGVPGASDAWWAGVEARLRGESNNPSLATAPGWTASGENDGDRFGVSVASAGDVNGDGYADAIVGARSYGSGQGRAYVYHGSSTGLVATPALTLTGENVGDHFGVSVAGAGDVNGDGYADAIVGAWGYATNTGRAYVYHGSAGGLAPTPALTLTGEANYENFGWSVAGAGDVNGDGYADAIVAADSYPSGWGNGRAYVYHGSAAGLGAAPALTLTGEQDGDLFGTSVASAGDVNGDGYADVIVGAYEYGSSLGAAYVYHGSGAGLGAAPALTLTGENSTDRFGNSVAGAGDVNGDGYADAIVGAADYAGGQGRAYLYHGSGAGLAAAPALTLTGESSQDRFGFSVAGGGDVDGDGYADAIVGAEGYGVGQGRAYIFRGSGAGLGATPALTLTGEHDGDTFATSVASAGDVTGDGYADLLVGAPGYLGGSNQGRAYAYHGSGAGLAAAPALILTGDYVGDLFGISVAGAGDVNGDGYADAIVGADGYGNDQGAAYIYQGSVSGLGATPALTLTGENDLDKFGGTVASAGDVNGDGYADAIVGAVGYPGFSLRGRAYVYHGSSAGLGAAPARILTGENDGDFFGYSVASAGDVNGDGYTDVLVGAYGCDNTQGWVYVYYGSDAGLGATPALTLTGENENDGFGHSVASAGDVNGDGYGDAIVGAPGYPLLNYQGRAYIYHGSDAGLGATPALTLTGENDGDRFGSSVTGAGDVNGDGYADAIVGAWSHPSDGGQGRAHVYHGSGAGLGATPARVLAGESAGDNFGFSVTGAGDVNGDGYADAVVGAHGYPSEGSHGAAYVYHGSIAGLGDKPALTLSGENDGDHLGTSVTGAGDVDGDGYADAIIGGDGYGGDQGRAYVYQGNGGGGRTVLARQARGDGGGTPVQAWGLSYAPDGFQVGMRATDPSGPGRVKLQVEVCPPGAAFGDGACTTHTGSAWTDVTAATGGVALTEGIARLNADTLYRWRARVLYAPYTVDQGGITPPPNPAHGPWRRWLGQAVEADVRTSPLLLVNSLNDPGDGTCDASECTLREAVSVAEIGSTIIFDAHLAGGTILLGSEIQIFKDLTLDGSGLDPHVQVSGGGSVRILAVGDPATVAIHHVDLLNGYADTGGGIGVFGGTLLLSDSSLWDSSADAGGCIYNENGEVAASSSTFFGCHAVDLGGAIHNLEGTVTISGCTFASNRTEGSGAGIYNMQGTATVRNSTFHDNQAAGSGGGIENEEGTLTMSGSTLSANSAPLGGGLLNSAGGTVHLMNSIVADSPEGGDCVSPSDLTTNIHNLIEDGSCGPTVSGDPLLESLADNGGPTWTMALGCGSPAINTGDDATCEATDQRGVSRLQGTHCDIGAYESDVGFSVNSLHDPGDGTCDAVECTLREAVAAAESGDNISFDTSLAGGTLTLGTEIEITKDLTIDGCGFTPPVQVSGGGVARVFAVSGGVTVAVDQVDIRNGHADNGGAIAVFSSTLTVSGSTFSGNHATNHGGAIHNHEGAITIMDSMIVSNTASLGGGIYNGNFGTTIVNGSTIISNTALYGIPPDSGKGGGIYNEAGTMTVDGSTVSANTAVDGGGICNYGTVSVQNGSTIGGAGAGNTATSCGGGISNGGTTTVDGSTVSANTAAHGGGICNGGTTTVDGSTVSANTAAHGGGIINTGTVIVQNGSTIGANTAEGGGGGIYNVRWVYDPFEPITLNETWVYGSTIISNTADLGGGIYNDGCYVTVYGTTVSANWADYGGGIYNLGRLDVLNGSTIGGAGAGNTAVNGGGIYNSGIYDFYPLPWYPPGTTTVDGSTVSSNSADDSGGGIYNHDGTTTVDGSTVSANTAENGGGIYNRAGLYLQNSSTIGANTAEGGGGGIYNSHPVDPPDPYTPPYKTRVYGSTIISNTAGFGGGIYNDADTTTVDGCTISANAAYLGGGIYNLDTLDVYGGTTISANSADLGGGIYNLDTLNVYGGTIGGAGASNTAEYGGGIYNQAGASRVVASLINSNAADYSGGGIYNNHGTTRVDGSTISANTANHSGGGIYNRATLHVQYGSIIGGTGAGNWAGQYGGGLYNSGGPGDTTTVDGSTISANSAGSGGGIFNNEGTLGVANCTLYGNDAGSAAGGIENYEGAMTIANSTLSANSAATGGGVVNSSLGTLHLVNSIVADSTSGGDCVDSGPLATNIHNLIEDGTCSPTLTGDPVLGSLADNGGPTLTMALGDGSPAIDAGDDVVCPATDQRGVVRPLDGDGDGTTACDIGAYEREPLLSVTVDQNVGGMLTYTDTQGNATIIEVPPGAVTEPTTLAYRPVVPSTGPPGFRFAGHGFDLDAYRDDVLLPGLTFSVPVTITLHYSEADLGGMDETLLVLERWNDEDHEWVDAACGPYDRHPDEDWLAVPICHLSRFGLFGTYRVYVPVVMKEP
jgi:CSLREA domain-containing protein